MSPSPSSQRVAPFHCVYCGAPLRHSTVCPSHQDLQRTDPEYVARERSAAKARPGQTVAPAQDGRP